MKVLLVGTTHAQILASQLQHYGVNAEAFIPSKIPSPLMLRKFDIIYGVYLTSLSRLAPLIRILRKKAIMHIIGSDAVRYANSINIIKKLVWNFTLNTCDEILFVREELKHIMGIDRGQILPISIDTRIFKKEKRKGNEEKRDILYYCPNRDIYRLDWILEYAKKNPNETVTIIGPYKSFNLPNVKVTPESAPDQMTQVYRKHRRLIRMTTQDGYPKMPYEALLSGLEVEWNNKKISHVPAELLMENTIPKLITILNKLITD